MHEPAAARGTLWHNLARTELDSMPFLVPVFTIGRADRAARRWRLALALFVVFAGVTNAAAARATVLAMPKAADAAYAAAYVSQVVPSLIEVFTPTSVSVTMRNTGTATWIASEGDVFLPTQEPQDNFYWCIQDNPHGIYTGNRVLLPHDVAPGQDVTFAFVVKPLSCRFAATAPFRFRMLSQIHGTFGDETPGADVVVSTSAQFVSQQAPDVAPAGARISVGVTFMNTTNVTWRSADGYALARRAGGQRDLGHDERRAAGGRRAGRDRDVRVRHRCSRRRRRLQLPVADDRTRRCAVRADIASDADQRRRRRTAELPGTVVGRSGGRRIGMGHRSRASGRRDLRDVVHLRCNRQGTLACNDREQGPDWRVHRCAAAEHRSAVQCRPVPAAAGAQRRRRQRCADVRRSGQRHVCVHAARRFANEVDRPPGVRTAADLHVRPRVRSERRVQLPGPVVGIARRQRVRLGTEPRARRRRDLRHVVHVRRRRHADVARIHGDEDRRHDNALPTAARFTGRPVRHSRRCRSIRRRSSRRRLEPRASRSPTAMPASSRIRSTTSPGRNRSRARSS